MAVVQISRIQIRRGQANQGSGVPQLASGELGWAVDTRELYIGNGSVSEGAPAVGNTKVLTEHDNLFTLVDTYAYRANDAYIVTGSSTTSPVFRTLQQRLDDVVSVRAFGVKGDGSSNDTVALQRALDQLYLNTATKGSTQSRVELHIPAGTYIVNNTIFIPPFATIIGAGSDKTIIRSSSSNPIFQTVNDSSTPGSPAIPATDSLINQARNIHLKGLSLETTATNGKAIVLQNCRDSNFEDLKLKGTWVIGNTIPNDYSSNIGVEINSLSGSVESKNNCFIKVIHENWAYAVMSNWDIDNNIWSECEFNNTGHGVAFGVDMSLGSAASGTSVGPSNNTIENSKFTNIQQHGIWVAEGKYNVSVNNYFELVGNNGGTDAQPDVAIIKFVKQGNESRNDYFTRTAALNANQATLINVVYVPEVEGPTNWSWGFENSTFISAGNNIRCMKLPKAVNQAFTIDYTLVSENYQAMRTGIITIALNGYTGVIELSDDSHYSGDVSYLDRIKFDATLIDEDGDATDETVLISTTSTMPVDDQTEFKYKVQTKQSDVI
jgi:hypothetical protein